MPESTLRDSQLLILPVRFHRDPADQAGIDPARGTLRPKHPRAYYLDGLTAVFQPGVSLPGTLRVEEEFANAEVVLLNPGPNAVEVLGILDRVPEIQFLHIIESCEKNLDGIRSELRKEVGRRKLPEMAGYITELRNLPEELAGRCDLVVEINVVDPKADKIFRQDAVRQVSRLLKLGGLFYSAGVTVRWTDRVLPLSLVPVPVRAKILKRVGYSDALPRPIFYLKHSPDMSIVATEEGRWRRWWRKGLALLGQGTKDVDRVAADAPLVPRVEDGRGEPNTVPWDFLITKPAVRRPAMDWTPQEGDRFGKFTLGSLLQFNSQTGMYVFLVRECPDVVLKMMKPFEGESQLRAIGSFTAGLLPEDRPRYLMGVGRPFDIVNAVRAGFDMFDCVIPTRNARNGTVYTSHGKLNIKRAEYADDPRPLDETCGCYCCKNFSRAYLRHLYMAGEILSSQLNSLHNLYFYHRLMDKCRKAIRGGADAWQQLERIGDGPES